LQVGKSFLLKKVLLARIAQHPLYGVGAPEEMRVLNLDLGDLPVTEVRIGLGRKRVGLLGVHWDWGLRGRSTGYGQVM
jgi:hypothetical protein